MWCRNWLSALSVVVNAQADARKTLQLLVRRGN
ncbi:hypothetical protein phiSTEC1575Stx2k_15 [Escherichia phage phiSTEC1575-Stx2k]|nr:hypothetical protein phiSTEC1575Stx2k_15 [Escherichia phage phiSTEC1575-Stx2k]